MLFMIVPKMMTCNKQAMAFSQSADSALDIITVSFAGLRSLIARVTIVVPLKCMVLYTSLTLISLG